MQLTMDTFDKQMVDADAPQRSPKEAQQARLCGCQAHKQ